MKYTDPNGEFWHLIIGAAIGGIVNWVFHGAEFSWKGLGYFGVGALSGALGAGIGSGITATLSGGSSFLAGFAGTQAAQTAIATGFTSSFGTGFLVGSAAGVGSGFVSGMGNGLLGGQDFLSSLKTGAISAGWSGLSGGISGGVIGGLDAMSNGRNFFTGDKPNISLPHQRPAGSTPSPMSPHAKGEAGVQRAMDEFVRDGGEVYHREVTIEVDKVRARLDFVGKKDGKLYLFEVKNGPKARLTTNQKIVYPKLQEGSSFIPRGKNASFVKFKGFEVGKTYEDDFTIIIKHYFD